MTQWFTVYVLPGREKKTRDLLLNRSVAQKAWQNSIHDILIPTEKEFVTRRGKRQIIDKKVFPGYLFIKMDMNKDSMFLVKGTEGISGFVQINNKPVPLEDNEVKNILKNIERSENIPKSTFKVNDIINIISGPFSDFKGKVDFIDDEKGKIKAYVMIFGRDTLVELEMNQVEAVK